MKKIKTYKELLKFLLYKDMYKGRNEIRVGIRPDEDLSEDLDDNLLIKLKELLND